MVGKFLCDVMTLSNSKHKQPEKKNRTVRFSVDPQRHILFLTSACNLQGPSALERGSGK